MEAILALLSNEPLTVANKAALSQGETGKIISHFHIKIEDGPKFSPS